MVAKNTLNTSTYWYLAVYMRITILIELCQMKYIFRKQNSNICSIKVVEIENLKIFKLRTFDLLRRSILKMLRL